MRDTRLTKLAQVLVNYSLGVKKGDVILLSGDLGGLPLIEAIYEECVKAGGHVRTSLLPPKFDELFYTYASDEQLAYASPISLQEIELCDKRIRVLAPGNTRALSSVDPKKQTLVSQSRREMMQRFMERSAKGELDWVLTLCPTAGGAQEAEMGDLEYEEFVFHAGYIDEADPIAHLRALEAVQEEMVNYMNGTKELHFQTPSGTDLRVNVEGMTWKNSCGKYNFPDGEIFTGPNLNAPDGGVNGVVRYSFPAIWNQTVVEGIELTFEKGRVVEAKAEKNELFLNEMIHQDEGASKLGEIAIGTNYRIAQFTKDILFDEKMGGTFHAALGAGYPETGNTNQSSLHWDMIADLREGGTIHVDGELISENGRFTKWELPGV